MVGAGHRALDHHSIQSEQNMALAQGYARMLSREDQTTLDYQVQRYTGCMERCLVVIIA